MDDGALNRYRARMTNLSALRDAARKADKVARAERAGELLLAIGDCLRRSGKLTAAGLDDALEELGPAGVEAFLESANFDGLLEGLQRACAQGAEGALAETEEERGLWIEWSQDALRKRDEAESQLVAVKRFEERKGLKGRALQRRTEWSQGLAAVDKKLKSKARWLTGLNSFRRSERDLLDAAFRELAWWFTARSECDNFIAHLSGSESKDDHPENCDPCREELLATVRVTEKRTRHLSEDDFFRLEYGLAEGAERTVLLSHAKTCGSCKEALSASKDADVEIDDALPDNVRTLEPVREAQKAQREVAAENEDFKVVLLRDPSRVRLVLEPKRPGRMAAAAVLVPAERGSTRIDGRQTAAGYEFDLGARQALDGKRVRLLVQRTAAPPFETDVTA